MFFPLNTGVNRILVVCIFLGLYYLKIQNWGENTNVVKMRYISPLLRYYIGFFKILGLVGFRFRCPLGCFYGIFK